MPHTQPELRRRLRLPLVLLLASLVMTFARVAIASRVGSDSALAWSMTAVALGLDGVAFIASVLIFRRHSTS